MGNHVADGNKSEEAIMAKQKVAILGGGIAAIVAAYELTSTEELRERYEVTVHQLGWRLGGKCASGRNEHHGQRIEEHGLHVWFGFYENAFRVMRETYAELGRPPDAPLATWRDAFKPCHDIVLYERHAGRWHGWSFKVPRNPLSPGREPELPHFWEMAHTLLDHLLGRWGALKATNPSVAAALAPPPSWLPFGVDRLAQDIVGGLLRCGAGDAERMLADALRLTRRRSEEGVGGPEEDADRALLWAALDAFKRWLWRYVVEPHLDDDDLRFFFTMFDAGSSMLQGIVEDRLIERGFDSVNDEDLRAWLRRHGAQPITLTEGVFVRALYDMAFAYEDGDLTRPRLAAGVAVHDALRVIFTYRGAIIWKMQAGMGDTVFAPLYEVLRRRGVRFEFFHWVSRLRLSRDRRFVEKIEVIPQVQLERAGYRPLVEVEDLECWPSEPHWDQIVDGQKLRERGVNLEWEANPLAHEPLTLRRGKDFDLVVLGISIDALKPICGELIADKGNRPFGEMIENSRMTMTQAFQLWLNRPLERLGWKYGENSIMTTFAEPLDTYANMTHLLPREAWPPAARVANIAYFCGVLEDRPKETQQDADERVRQQAIDYLRRNVPTIWPESVDRDGFDWNLLVDGRGKGPGRFATQFWRANFQPTERYVLTPPGGVEHRLAAGESGYENLLLAGDWVRNGLDVGCVEAATMAGMQAARAICGAPAAIVGEDGTWLAGGSPSVALASPGRLPRYVEYGGLTTCPSPIECSGSTLYSFCLLGDLERLRRLCRHVFYRPSCGKVDVRPLAGCVMLTFGVIDKATPELKPWSEMGWATERQVAFWIPVGLVRGGVVVEVGWFVPYMWVDDPISLSGGREIYGYNKHWGWIGLPDGHEPERLTLDAYGGNAGVAGRHRLIELAASGALSTGAMRFDDLPGAVEYARATLAQPDIGGDSRLEVPDSAFDDILRLGGPAQFYLRQFRSITDGRRASQQQITDSRATVQRIVGWELLPKFEFTLRNLESHPLATELGVRSQSARLALKMQMDFVLEDGAVMWQA